MQGSRPGRLAWKRHVSCKLALRESKHLSTIWFLPPVNSQARYMPEWLGSCQSGMVWASGRPNVKSKTDLSPDSGRLQAKGRFFWQIECRRAMSLGDIAGAAGALVKQDLHTEKTIVIVRHGLATWSAAGRIQAGISSAATPHAPHQVQAKAKASCRDVTSHLLTEHLPSVFHRNIGRNSQQRCDAQRSLHVLLLLTPELSIHKCWIHANSCVCMATAQHTRNIIHSRQ